jgi:hypothetical protein
LPTRSRDHEEGVLSYWRWLASSAVSDATQDPNSIFESVQRCFAGRLDVKLTSGPHDAPLLKAAGQSFAMLHNGNLVVRLHPMRCAELVDAGKGRLLELDGTTHEDWIVIDGHDGALWTSHAMEALASAKG